MESDFEFIPQQAEPLSVQSVTPYIYSSFSTTVSIVQIKTKATNSWTGSLKIIKICILKMLISIMHLTQARMARSSKMNRPKKKNCAPLEVGYSLKSIASAFLSTILPDGVCDAHFQFSWINRWLTTIGETDSHRHCKVSFGNLGLTCIGPSPESGHVIFEQCPKNVTIDLDTARLFLEKQPKGIKLVLEGRCVACHFHCQMTRYFRRSGLEIKAENTICKVKGCDHLSFLGSGGCPQHLPRLITAAYRSKATIDYCLVREKFDSMAQKRWSFPPNYNAVLCRMSDILQGKRPGSNLVILDDEFSLASR
jgi:hypothetical protein